MSSILRWLLCICLISIPYTTSLSNENCNNDRYNEREGYNNKDECDGTGKTELQVRKYSEKERTDEWMSLPANEKQLNDLFLSGKLHPAMKMADTAMKMKRSPNQVFLLLVGLSGSGNSSTVNYLFETNIAKSGESKSETRSTTEYILQLKSTEWRIPDLTLSLIDTPGFGDTDGFEQDAKMSIRYFLNSHPNLRQNSYPNLMMIMQSINDNRIKGESSNFAKMLKGLSKIGAIDHNNPNIVIVLTHATSIARNLKIWEEKVKKKKEEVKAIVRLYLGVKPEVVVQENLPEDNRYDLERDGDWHRLPNGEKQPKILYRACKRILNRAGDIIGHEAVAIGLRHGINKSVVKGYSISSSEVTRKDADDMRTILIQSIVLIPSSSEVGSMLENYKKKEKYDIS